MSLNTTWTLKHAFFNYHLQPLLPNLTSTSSCDYHDTLACLQAPTNQENETRKYRKVRNTLEYYTLPEDNLTGIAGVASGSPISFLSSFFLSNLRCFASETPGRPSSIITVMLLFHFWMIPRRTFGVLTSKTCIREREREREIIRCVIMLVSCLSEEERVGGTQIPFCVCLDQLSQSSLSYHTH
jgi:hypothetical protein